MISDRALRTGAWYGDQPLSLDFPDEWDVTFFWPKTPPPLTDEQIADTLQRPIGQPPIREICKGKSRPLVIVDDLNRPTPAARVMPFLLKDFQEAGIPNGNIRILMAPGAHGLPPEDGMTKKVGSQAAASCMVGVHDWTRNVTKMGRTSFGTPVMVNRHVVASDFVVGIGGIYPNDSAGFGGGSKLALGVLGKRSIMHLHYRHKNPGWGSSEQSDFRKDLDEIARIIGLNTMLSLHVDADREVVRVSCGDPLLYYTEAVAFSKEAFHAPMPEDADVVVSNAYPNDSSLTFVRKKGMIPLRYCAPGVSRIVVASCSEGIGQHRLYPEINLPRFHRERVMAQRISVMKPSELPSKVTSRLRRWMARNRNRNSTQDQTRKPMPRKNPVWLYQTGSYPEKLPLQFPHFTVSSSWPQILQAVQKEQHSRKDLKVLIYPCAPLQSLDPPARK